MPGLPPGNLRSPPKSCLLNESLYSAEGNSSRRGPDPTESLRESRRGRLYEPSPLPHAWAARWRQSQPPPHRGSFQSASPPPKARPQDGGSRKMERNPRRVPSSLPPSSLKASGCTPTADHPLTPGGCPQKPGGGGASSRVGVSRGPPELGGGASGGATPPPQHLWSSPPTQPRLPGIPLSHFRARSRKHSENSKCHSILWAAAQRSPGDLATVCLNASWPTKPTPPHSLSSLSHPSGHAGSRLRALR